MKNLIWVVVRRPFFLFGLIEKDEDNLVSKLMEAGSFRYDTVALV